MKRQRLWWVACIATVLMGNPMDSVASNTQDSEDQAPAGVTEGRNRLGETTSPYLLQHASNPVHWYPWGAEAFEAARSQGKMIFLSIGYSTCYWCHVMERECFEDQEVADYLNAHFIAIKVDREERPDVDEIYMTSVQVTGGRGGWPLTALLEPTELRPFFLGTYFPKSDKGQQPGLLTILTYFNSKWMADRDPLLERATAIAKAVTEQLTARQEPTQLTSKVIEKCTSTMLAGYDATNGGFSRAPKFPMPMFCDYLMEAAWDIPQARKAVKKTLDSMFMGGMYDQVGGGFHRYSTDAKWLIPHFEKMLYDNAQLVSTYARAYARTNDASYARVIRETLAYVNRELSSQSGGFFSAQDAETNHLEGETYLWREAELRDILTKSGMEDDIALALSVYGVDQGTNFQDPHHPNEPRANVLHLTNHPSRLASANGLKESEFQEKIDAIDAALLKVRDTRDQPLTDDKVIAAWNGLMIAAFADAGRILGEQAWVERAVRASTFILSDMRRADGSLLRTWRAGKGGADAFLIDYGAMIRGLLAIYQANQDARMLTAAVELYDKARELHYVQGQGWFDTQEGQSDLFVRTRALIDGAMPSATSLMLSNQVTLSSITRDSRFLNDAIATLDAQSQLLDQSPLAAVVATQALHDLLSTHPEKFNEPFEVTMANPSPVRMSCEPEILRIASGESTTITVQLRMATRWHVNANAPQNEYAIPLSFHSLDDNITIEPTWPQSVRVTSAGESVQVFTGSTSIPITIHASAKAKGQFTIMVTWQACNEDSCLAPETTRVPCTITVE